MINSYFMAGANFLILVTIFISIVFIHYRFPKVRLFSFPLLLVFAVLPLLSIARIGTYESGDLSLNVYKTMDFYRSLHEGNIVPTWAGQLNATYGYPLFIFTYPLPYYLNAFFHFIGFSFISSVKMTLVTSFLFSGISLYYFLREKFSERASFYGSMVYLYAPYHLVDMHFRVDIGEMCAIAFVPCVFLAVSKISHKQFSPLWISLGGISTAALILSHQAVSLTALPFILLFILTTTESQERKKVLTRAAAMLGLGLLLCSFYVLPLLALKQFTIQSHGVIMSFSSITELLYSPWIYGFRYQGALGELSFLIGYIQLVLLGMSLYLLKTKTLFHMQKKYLYFCLIGTGILLFFILPISEPIWYILPLIKNFQFSYRLLAVVIFFFAVIGAIVAEKITKPYVFILVLFLTIGITILNWGNRRVIPEITDTTLAQELPRSTYYGEGLSPAAPKWVDTHQIWMKDIPHASLEVLSGNAELTVKEHTTMRHIYDIQVKETSTFKENTLYFPGWKVMANNKLLPLHYTNPTYPGIITFTLPKGSYHVVVVYELPQVVVISRLISLTTVLSLLGYLFVSYRSVLFTLLHKKR